MIFSLRKNNKIQFVKQHRELFEGLTGGSFEVHMSCDGFDYSGECGLEDDFLMNRNRTSVSARVADERRPKKMTNLV